MTPLELVLLVVITSAISSVIVLLVLGAHTRRLEQQLRIDTLTGIANRRAFDDEARHHQRDSRVVLAMIDLDRFKDVNDTHGHPAGDATLIRVAQTIEDVVQRRAPGLGKAYRFAGDEFAILLRDHDIDHARLLLDEVRIQLEQVLESHERGIRISAGLAATPVHTSEWASLVSFADRALYQAKRSGRNRTTSYSPDQLDMEASRDPLAMLRVLATALGAAVDAKDAYTHAHSHNVADLSGYLARTIGLGDDEVDEIFLGGLLHDVGKIGVADAVLKKPGPLDPGEWAQVRAHCEIGYRILNSIDGAQRVQEMVLSHHEKPDGTGYPNGLTGPEIPLGARIIAVADAFDSMTADRVYRRALTSDEALAEIVRQSGVQFDEMVVTALCDLMLYDPSSQTDEVPEEVAAETTPPEVGDVAA